MNGHTVKETTPFCKSSVTEGADDRIDSFACSHISTSLSYTSVEALVYTISESPGELGSFVWFDIDFADSSVHQSLASGTNMCN